MACGGRDVVLAQGVEIASLGDDAAYELVILLAAPLLAGAHRVAVAGVPAPLWPRCAPADGLEVCELDAPVSGDHAEQPPELLGPHGGFDEAECANDACWGVLLE